MVDIGWAVLLLFVGIGLLVVGFVAKVLAVLIILGAVILLVGLLALAGFIAWL